MSWNMDTSTAIHMASEAWQSIEEPAVPLGRQLYGHHFAGLLLEGGFDKVLENGWEKAPIFHQLFLSPNGGCCSIAETSHVPVS